MGFQCVSVCAKCFILSVGTCVQIQVSGYDVFVNVCVLVNVHVNVHVCETQMQGLHE